MSNEIEHSIRQKVNQYRVEPDADVWLAVEQAIGVAKRKKQRFMIARYAAAIVLLLMVGGGATWLATRKITPEGQTKGTHNLLTSSPNQNQNQNPNQNQNQNADNKSPDYTKDTTENVPAKVKARKNNATEKKRGNTIRSVKQTVNKQLADVDKNNPNSISEQTYTSNTQQYDSTSAVIASNDVNPIEGKANSTNNKSVNKQYDINDNEANNTTLVSLHNQHKNDLSIGLLLAGNTATGNSKPASPNPQLYNSPNVASLPSSEVIPVFELSDSKADHHVPLSFGFAVQKNINQRFAVETGVMYTYLRSIFTANQTKRTQNLHYIGIPLSGIVNVTTMGNLSLYLSAGGMVERNIARRVTTSFQDKTIETENSTVQQLQWSVNTYVGLNYQFYRNLGFYIEPGWAYFFDNNSPLQSYRTQHPSTFNFRAGFRMGF